MILEPCPYCGKSFKRLKAHIPHCKLSPLTKRTGSGNIPKEIQSSPSQNITINNKADKIKKNPSLQTNQRSKSKAFESTIMDQKESFSNVHEMTGVLTAEGVITDPVKPKMKWLARREEEMLKQAHVLTGKGIKPDIHNRKTCQSPEKETLQLNTANTTKLTTISDLQRVSYTGSFGTKQSTPTPQVSTDVLKQIRSNPEHFIVDLSLTQKVKEQTHVTFTQAKTSVWDHIKYGLHDERSSCAPLIHRVCTSDDRLHRTKNIKSAVDSSTVQVISHFPTSPQSPAEQILTSRLQNVNIKGFTPNMATGYAELFSSPHSDVSYNVELLTKHRSSKSSPQSRDCIKEQRLGDVRLREVTYWLGSRAPTSPREVVALLNKGRHWYYRKYIDVQRGGIGGIAMLVAGYCVLSYIWSYPHLKQERWRKYH